MILFSLPFVKFSLFNSLSVLLLFGTLMLFTSKMTCLLSLGQSYVHAICASCEMNSSWNCISCSFRSRCGSVSFSSTHASMLVGMYMYFVVQWVVCSPPALMIVLRGFFSPPDSYFFEHAVAHLFSQPVGADIVVKGAASPPNLLVQVSETSCGIFHQYFDVLLLES